MTDEQNQEAKCEPSEFEKCQQERTEYLNNWKRERADFLNYKKDEAQRFEEFAKFASEAVVLEVIEVLDDLEKAAKEINNEGLSHVLKKFEELLNKYGLEKIKTEEEKFDPRFHEAVEPGEGERIEEIRAGYTIRGKVIRPARVKIVK